MQRALKVQVMNHVMRRQLNLGESGIREQKLVQNGNDIQSIRLRYVLHCSELEEGSCGVLSCKRH